MPVYLNFGMPCSTCFINFCCTRKLMNSWMYFLQRKCTNSLLSSCKQAVCHSASIRRVRHSKALPGELQSTPKLNQVARLAPPPFLFSLTHPLTTNLTIFFFLSICPYNLLMFQKIRNMLFSWKKNFLPLTNYLWISFNFKTKIYCFVIASSPKLSSSLSLSHSYPIYLSISFL